MSVHARTSGWLPALRSMDYERAWDEFLSQYAGLILQVVQLFERDRDSVDDCFVFICEHLKRDKMKKVRRFDTSGPATFETWLRAVVRNLYLDWRRKKFGRPRLYRSIAQLPRVEQEVFRCIYLRGMSENEAFHNVKALYPALSRLQLADCLVHIRAGLTAHQAWLLASNHPRLHSIDSSERDPYDTGTHREIASEEPDPEAEARRQESLAALGEAMRHLTHRERLLLRLRYEQELTLEQIAQVTRLGSAVTVQRALDRALKAIRDELTANGSAAVSVKDS